jgi:pimeloyl-ACP methyl ester carboxylesterase
MVHGASQNRRVFDRQVQVFQADYRLLLIDLPGHGLSADLSGPYGLEEFAASISGALRAAGVAQTHFWGTHSGAGAGLWLACNSPETFVSLVLEGPVIPGHPLPAVTNTLQAVTDVMRRQGVEAAREFWWQEGGWFSVMRKRPIECRAGDHRAIIDEFMGQPWLHTGLALSSMTPIDDSLRNLEIPVLIINGEHDVVDFIEAANALGAIIPNCQRAVIEEAGGFPLWEFPERVNTVVRAFLPRG